MIDKVHFKDLSEHEPDEVCRRTGSRYHSEEACYELSVWGEIYRIFPHRFEVKGPRKGTRFRSCLGLFAVHYLLGAQAVEPVHTWVSGKDVPIGAGFFRGPHEIPTGLISRRFSGRMPDFHRRCRELDGTPLSMADAAYTFEVTPRVPVAVLYWEGDDEFPDESGLLYDKTITRHLANDIIYALAVGVCHVVSSG